MGLCPGLPPRDWKYLLSYIEQCILLEEELEFPDLDLFFLIEQLEKNEEVDGGDVASVIGAGRPYHATIP